MVQVPPPCSPRLLRLLLPYLYTGHASELNALLVGCGEGELLVPLAYVAASLMLPELKDAALQLCGESFR